METFVNTDIPVFQTVMGNARIPATAVTTSQTFPIMYDILPVDATAGVITITLPLLSRSWANGIGRMCCVAKIDSSGNAVTIKGNGAETIEGVNTLSRPAQWSKAWLIATPTGWLVLAAN